MISTIVVTYADRWAFLFLVLQSLQNDSCINEVVLIDNASSYDVSDRCREHGFNKVTVHRNERNLGSAAGFAMGITTACNRGAEFILLLDDDNVPRNNTVTVLKDSHKRLVLKIPSDRLIVTAYRECQHGRFRMPRRPVFMSGHDFLNFNVFNAMHRHLDLIKFETEICSGPEFANHCRGGAYSGMFFSRDVVAHIGLPRTEYVLYFDDIDFVIRTLEAGGVVWLEYNAVIDDIEENYSVSVFNTPILGFVKATSDAKIYYIIRNRAYLDRYVEKKTSFAYRLNKVLFITLVGVCCILLFKWKRLLAIAEACSHAYQGKLGEDPRYTL